MKVDTLISAAEACGARLSVDGDEVEVEVTILVEDDDRLETVVVVVGVEQPQLLAAVHRIEGVKTARRSSGFSKPTATAPIGVPVGIEFLGRPRSEPVLIRIAYAFEQATRFRRPPPSTPTLK